jgi:hypothetical protein
MLGLLVHQCPGTDEQPGRRTADTITDDELDELYGDRNLSRHLLANVRQTCTEALNRAEKAERVAQSAARDTAKALTDYLAAEQRAEQAEAANARARALVEPIANRPLPIGYDDWEQALKDFATELLAALDEPAP